MKELPQDKGKFIGAVVPRDWLSIEEAIKIVAEGGKIFRNSTGGQVGIRFPETPSERTSLNSESSRTNQA